MDIYQTFKRCGVCGSPMNEDNELIIDLDILNGELWCIDWDKVELDYCSNCTYSIKQDEENDWWSQQLVSRDMAIDGGDLSMEGQSLSIWYT